jgi:16S rRNA (adenine(1408)-N(1))-methyltransferase
VTIDVGTGDGRAVLDAAARDPRTLVLGLDAVATAMAEASRRAAGPARKGGLPNAAFVVAAAAASPAELCGLADLVTVRFPWGSLLRGCVGGDSAVAAGVARLVAPRGALELLLAASARDNLDGVPLDPGALAQAAATAFAPFRLALVLARPATDPEVAASGSTWARRLRAGRHDEAPGRTPTLIRLERR